MMKRMISGEILLIFALVFLANLGAAPALAADSTESVCIQCHSTLSGSLGEPVKLWEKSLHKEVGTTCDACHGGDPKNADATWLAHKSSPEMARKLNFLGKPSETDIPRFCGKCHSNIKENFVGSAHAAMGVPNCVTCHTAHSVQRASLSKIKQEVCVTCHDDSRADRLESLIQGGRERLKHAADLVERYKAYLVPQVEDQLKKAEGEGADVRSIFHTFSMEKIKAEIESLNKKVDDIDLEIEKTKQELKRRKRIGLGALIFALGTAATLYYYRKSLPIPHE